jgi:hypothetical protein
MEEHINLSLLAAQQVLLLLHPLGCSVVGAGLGLAAQQVLLQLQVPSLSHSPGQAR